MSWVEIRPGEWDRGDGEVWLSPEAARRWFEKRTGIELPELPVVADYVGPGDQCYLREFQDLPPVFRLVLSRIAIVKKLPLKGTVRPEGCETLADIMLDGRDGLVRRMASWVRRAREVVQQYRDLSVREFVSLARERGLFLGPCPDEYFDRESCDSLVAGFYMAAAEVRRLQDLYGVRRGPRPQWFWVQWWRDLHGAGLGWVEVASLGVAYEVLPEALAGSARRPPGSCLVYPYRRIVDVIRQAVRRAA